MTVSIYPEINSKIQTILESVPKIKEIYAYPATEIERYPAAIYFPATVNNSFETSQENMKIYNYKLFIVINTGNKTIQDGYSIMARVMDSVLEKIDSEWSFDNINGHRVWGKFETGNWDVTEVQGGIELSAEIDLSVKMLTNN